MNDASGQLALSAQLSNVLVAFTVELDNEFEHQMPHRTTRHGSTAGHPHAPWLVSFPMWVHCMRHVPEEGIRAGDLVRKSGLTAKTMQHVVKRLAAWWGYLTVGEPTAGLNGTASAASRLVRPSDEGRHAQDVWRPLEKAIEGRWRGRFGAEAVGRLQSALAEIVSRLDTALPDYLPLGEPRLRPGGGTSESVALGLPALVSKALLVLALDFDQRSDLALGIYTSGHVSRLTITANILRALDERGVRVSQIPARTGVAKMTIDNWLGSLDDHGYVTIGTDPAGGRFKVAKLTDKGQRSQELYRRWAGEAEHRLAQRFGSSACHELRKALAPVIGGAGIDSSLRKGMEPYPDGWRAQLPQASVLPHYPVISMRGGFPDGS
jgi:DNA-binding MarR family transcriptional regulator